MSQKHPLLDFQVDRVFPCKKDGKVVAFFQLKWPKLGMNVSSLKLIIGPYGDFIAFPSHQKTNPEGETKYVTDIFLEKEIRETLSTAVCKEVRAKMASLAAETPSAPEEEPAWEIPF